MKTLKAPTEFGKAYLDLNHELDSLIKGLVDEAAERLFPDGYGHEVEALECRSRDGFSAFAHNCGGYQARSFTDVRYVEGSGNWYASKEANKQIEEMLEFNRKAALESFQTEYAAELVGIPVDKLNYHDLYELGKGKLAERLSEAESELGSDDTIMHDLRVMYGGVDRKGVHTAWVSAAVNWEAPYHRSHISWMPGMKCEHAVEIEITFKTLKGAERKIKAALDKVKKQIF